MIKISFSELPRAVMGSFGEELRRERIARGISLEQVTTVTKISLRNLLALEQERFRQLPGGILNKGIVRAYVISVGLDPDEWIERYNRAYATSGQMSDDERNWTAFATNVGKARFERNERVAMRIRWIVTAILLIASAALCYLAVRYFGLRAHWWPTFLPAWLHFGFHLPASIHNWIYR